MKQRSILIGVFLWCSLSTAGAWAGQHHRMGRVGCPHCVNDGSEVSQLLQQFDALYAAFKPKAALGAVTRVLELDPNNQEGLAKA
ncbi:MAG: hypothetical protein ACREQP_06705, partial [Candidatus Binatia bacterium]